MALLNNLFNRYSRKDGTYLTEVTLLKPGVYDDYRQRGDFVEFTDMRLVKPSAKKTETTPKFRQYRITPMQALAAKQSVYTHKDLERIAEMFLVTYTHCTDETQLPNYQKRNAEKGTKKGGMRFFQLIRKIFS